MRSERKALAAVPPMGWNSYTCFYIAVREEEVKANARYIAERLARYGWQYVVIDGMWYEDTGPIAGETPWERKPFRLDPHGRLLPESRRFPSAAGEAGLKPIADYAHRLGLKFGLHIMRGIPRLAVDANCPILGTPYRARDVADPANLCPWYDGMVGMKPEHPGSQAYYDSLLAQYAGWGVDYIKADDMETWLGGAVYREWDVRAVSTAIDRCKRPMLLSLSGGLPTDTSFAEHRKTWSELWRITDDLHDEWPAVRQTFDALSRWMPHSGPGHWADPDMLPFGKLHIRESANAAKTGRRTGMTRLTRDEQVTVMTLWCISRSPLMFAGDLPGNDDWTLLLITNPDVLAVNQRSSGNRELFRRDDIRVWIATAEDGRSRYVACFNLSDAASATVRLPFAELLLPDECHVRDLWARQDMGSVTDFFSVETPPHGARLLKIWSDQM